MATLRSAGAVVEVLGWDEAFLGVEHRGPRGVRADAGARVRAATELDCSVGIGENKLQAKIATGFGKPAGVFRLTAANWFAVMGDRPPTRCGASAQDGEEAGRAGHRHRQRPGRGRPARAGRGVRPDDRAVAGAAGCGRGDAEVDDAAYVAGGHGREETFQQTRRLGQVQAEVARLAGLRRRRGRGGRPAVRVW